MFLDFLKMVQPYPFRCRSGAEGGLSVIESFSGINGGRESSRDVFSCNKYLPSSVLLFSS